ncbi:hypothetical protein [Flavobacterium muglaense]|uniref:Uncharacterized protein n=1 Tax=Flavobacterium muglaense TaxID=2764716 RepID=A0A923MY03_9FLAO|nr:hypothetical protein [Flavobacterium muglaense]MBC5836610.1 hypothetical protein [Flavobacterium muglaense]MBC5843124.1 hypothetical protein [Flavobacterium muglaense]
MEKKTLLHRQIHPTFVVNDIVSNQAFSENEITISSGAFTPSEKDDDKLSVYNGEKFSPKESFDHFVNSYTSYGVLSLTVEEINSIEPLIAVEDNDPFDGHCHIDFSEVSSKNQKTKKAGKLRDFAVNRKWTYKPQSN